MTTKKKTTAKRRVSNKKITLNEFKAWLEGVEELQPAGWNPDQPQWKLIRNKIKNIIDEPAPAPAQPVQPMYPQNRLPQSGVSGIPPAPPVPGGVPANAVVSNDPGLKPNPDAVKLFTGTKDTPAKTPEMTDGTFTTPFA